MASETVGTYAFGTPAQTITLTVDYKPNRDINFFRADCSTGGWGLRAEAYDTSTSPPTLLDGHDFPGGQTSDYVPPTIVKWPNRQQKQGGLVELGVSGIPPA